MNLKTRFINWMRNTQAKVTPAKYAFPQTEHIIKYAFTSGGVKYYQMHDIFNIPWKRGMEAISAYEELEMRCDKSYLMHHYAFMKDLVNGPKFTLEELQKLNAANEQLKQRLDWVVVPEHAYKLASIVFFDASENPESYELGYGKEKIKKWKENDDVQAFFLRKPIKELMPFLEGFVGNFQTYSQTIQKVNHHHLRNLSTGFSERPESKVTVKP